jgi:hypothetical protein
MQITLVVVQKTGAFHQIDYDGSDNAYPFRKQHSEECGKRHIHQ